MNELYCPKCEVNKTPLVPSTDKSGNAVWQCPQCRHKITQASSSNTAAAPVRLAQYGGSGGGQTAPFSPGSSPFSRGSQGGGSGINKHQIDIAIDAIMDRTRQHAPDDAHRNMEVRLEPFHSYFEDDKIPYELSLEQREKLKLKKQIHRREKFYEDCAKSIRENTPDFIQKNFKPTNQQMRTIEESLASKHMEPKNQKPDPREDVSPAQDKPTRRHPMSDIKLPPGSHMRLAQDYMGHGTGRMRGDEDDDSDVESPNDVDNARYHMAPMGNTPLLTTGHDVDQYIDQLSKADWGGGDGPNVTTLMDYPNADEIGDHSVGHTDPMPSPTTQSSPSIIANPSVGGLEQKLRTLHDAKIPKRLPGDPYSVYNTDKYEGDEPRGVSDKYPSSAPEIGNANLPHM